METDKRSGRHSSDAGLALIQTSGWLGLCIEVREGPLSDVSLHSVLDKGTGFRFDSSGGWRLESGLQRRRMVGRARGWRRRQGW